MTVSLIVPVTADRERNWAWLRFRYAYDFPDWEIIEHSDPVEPWSKGAAVNAAAERATGAVYVIADADLHVEFPYALLTSLGALRDGAPWVVPYDRVYRLSEGLTERVVSDAPDSPINFDAPDPRPLPDRVLERPSHRGPAGGGIVVVRAADFHAVGGVDPAFTVWGGEDEAFGRALDTLIGPHVRLGYPAWHLWHPTLRPPNGRSSAENEALAGLYRDAVGDREAMAALCARKVVA